MQASCNPQQKPCTSDKQKAAPQAQPDGRSACRCVCRLACGPSHAGQAGAATHSKQSCRHNSGFAALPCTCVLPQLFRHTSPVLLSSERCLRAALACRPCPGTCMHTVRPQQQSCGTARRPRSGAPRNPCRHASKLRTCRAPASGINPLQGVCENSHTASAHSADSRGAPVGSLHHTGFDGGFDTHTYAPAPNLLGCHYHRDSCYCQTQDSKKKPMKWWSRMLVMTLANR